MVTASTEIAQQTVVARMAAGWHLFVISADWFRAFPLDASSTVEVGRSAACKVVLNDGSVSRRHLKITHEAPDGISFEDLGSANGLRLNGESLAPGASGPLSAGDRIAIGTSHIVVGRGEYYPGRRRAMTFDALETAINDACAKGRVFTFVHWQLAKRMPWPLVAARLASVIPAPHGFAAYGDRHYLGLLSGLVGDAAERLAQRALATLAEGADDGRFAWVIAPRDGLNAEVLLERVMAAVRPVPARVAAMPAAPARALNAQMQRALELSERAARSNISVLLLGETGVGKEVMARRIHEASPRRNAPFVALNCPAFSESLMESELFGHEKGAFTGASTAKPGLLESAGNGSIFLDEIGDMPLALQVKLLRVLESREVLRVGSVKPRQIEARFIAGTNHDLEADILSGKFRSDLFYRIAGITIHTPPLRARMDELPALSRHFVDLACESNQRAALRISDAALEALSDYHWPGNIRELRNVLERAVVLCDGDEILLEHLPSERLGGVPVSASVERRDAPMLEGRTLPPSGRDERAHIIEVLQRNAGNQTRASLELGISRKTLIKRLEKYDISRPQKGR